MSQSSGSHRLFAVSALLLGPFVLRPAFFAPLVRAEEPSKSAAGDSIVVPEGTPEELLAFIKQLQRPKREMGSRAERMAKRKQTAAVIVAAADKILESQAAAAIVAAALTAEFDTLPLLSRLGDKQADARLTALIDKYKNDARPAIAQAVKLRDLAQRIDELERAAGPDTGELKELIAELKENLSTGEPNEAATSLAYRVGKLVERSGAIDLYREFAALPRVKNGARFAAQAEELERAARKLDMVGHPLDIEGTLLDGSEIDWPSYRGKVVLVDFWATWCGPCVAELPNVKETYEKYHEQGFDVVGISLDQDRAALEEFLRKDELPWPIVFSDDREATTGSQAMAVKYGVDSIPRAILVDRQGNVVTLEARGEVLGEMVAKLLEKP